MLHRALILCALLLGWACVPALAAGDDVPAWLQQAAALKVPSYDQNVHAVVLHDESTITVDPDGRQVEVETWAVRILHREGRGYAEAAAVYDTNSGKVRELHAWLIRANGSVKRYGKDETSDEAAALNNVYDDYRIKSIKAGDDAEPGSVFGYQLVKEERADFNQNDWFFQNSIPVLSSRLTLTLPAGWQATSVTFNHEKVEPAVSGSSYTWELRDLPAVEDEPAGPSMHNLLARLEVAYAPPANTTLSGGLNRNYSNWTDVSRWYTDLSAPQTTADDALATEAQRLTLGAKTELERIQAIGRFVQNLQYISIQIGIGRFRPHAATEVFAKKYGDCKDKANLMRAMLKVVGIEAYPVLIYAGDPTYVHEEWASPSQFNHCIVAVKVSEQTQAASVIQHPKLGRLLIFDATDDDTPVGDLPLHEQNSFALIAAGEAGGLVRMPVTPPEANQTERQADVTLNADGTITAVLHERSIGQAAVRERAGFHHLARPEYNQMIARWIAHGATGAQVTKVEPSDNSAEGKFALDVEFNAANYGQLMQNRLLVFKPAIVERREHLFLTDAKRKHPVVLPSYAYSETVKVKLPAGFDVDELPDPVKLDAPFGSYAATYAVKDGQLQFTRTLVQHAATIPVEQYATVRTFFERIRAAEQAPVVLARQ